MPAVNRHPLLNQLLDALNQADGERARDLYRRISEILFGAECSVPSSQADVPSWVAEVQRRLDRIERTIQMVSKNTSAIAQDWPALKAAIEDDAKTKAQQIKDLMAERDELKVKEATGEIDDDDEARLGEVDAEMKTMLDNLHKTPATDAPAPTTDQGSGANTPQGTHDTTSAGGDPAQGAAATGGPSAGAGTNDAISGGVAGDTSGAKSA